MRDVVQLTTEVPVRPAAPAPDVPHRSPDVGFWAVFVAVLAIGSAAAFVMYRLDNSSLVYFGDTASHLFGSRKMADWAEDPASAVSARSGCRCRTSSSLPFTLVGPMFSTGFAGFAVSLPSLALSAAFLYKIIRTHLAASAFVAGAGALLYVLNPNTLYLGLIAMTEAPFMLFFVGSAYFLQRWIPPAERPAGPDVVVDARRAGHAVPVRGLDPPAVSRLGGRTAGRAG